MMKFKRWIGLILIMAMACSLMACSLFSPKEEADTADTSVTTESVTPPDSNEPVVFLKSDLEKFKIAYATDLGKDAMAEVQKLADRIKKTYGVTIIVTSDFIMSSNAQMKEWENEILIGHTNREESAEFQRNLREDDYGYGYKDGKILISGGNSEAVKNAIVMFALDVIVGHSSDDVFYRSEWTKIEKKNYTIDSMKLNGVAINEYEIIYPNASHLFEKEMAGRLQNIVAEMTGFTLPVLSDIEAKSAETAFLIGKTKFSADVAFDSLEDNEGCVMGKGSNVIAYADNLQGMVDASKLLTDLLFDKASSEKVREITIGEAKKTDGNDAFSIMTHNLLVSDITAERIANTMKLIYQYMPDTLGVQEASPAWMSALRDHLSGYYEIVGEGREGGTKGEHSAILYAKTKYNLIESGTKWLTDTPDKVSKLPDSNYIRIFTWALLEDKVTGQRYLHVNTHLDGGAVNMLQVKYLMQFLKAYNDVAVVLTGDMNATISTEDMKYLQANGFASKYDYKELDHLPISGRGYNVIDWIFVTKDCATLTNYVTDDNYFNGAYASDHNSYYAEFTVQTPTDGKIDHGWDDLDIGFSPDGWLEVKPDEEGSDYGDLIIRR